MKTKAKKFSHKLLALFLAIVMGVTCFSGVLTSYAATSKNTKYADGDVEYNDIAWNVLSDEQLATAILDYADLMLPAVDDMISGLAKSVDGTKVSVLTINWSNHQVKLKVGAITLATITVNLSSVDNVIQTLESVQSTLDGGLMGTAQNLGVDLGIIFDLDLSSVKNMRRSSTTSCDIVRGVLGLIYKNNDKVIGDLFRGDLSLGLLNDTINVYKIVGDLVGAPDGYQHGENGMVYNIVRSLIFNNTSWYTDTQEQGFIDNPSTFIFDDQLLDKMTTELLDKINILVTYPDGTSSKTRKAQIDAVMATNGGDYRAAATQLGYDPDLIYSTENKGNVLLFAYGTDKIRLTSSDSLFSFGYQALKYAWKTVLKDTVKLLHVNYDVDRHHGSNFDNAYYYWASKNLTWDQNNLPEMYKMENLVSWANSPATVDVKEVVKDGQTTYVSDAGVTFPANLVQEIEEGKFVANTTVAGTYGAFGADAATEFLGWVKNNYEFDRDLDEGTIGKWSDIDANTLFNKIRYSPIADYTFNMQTGPINLYFMQTGTPHLDAFFDGYCNYNKTTGKFQAGTHNSLVAGLNDALVAAVYDIFLNRDNIYKDTPGDTKLGTLGTCSPTTIDDSSKRLITSTLVNNALKVVQYTADTTDKNILNKFYEDNHGYTALTEANLETAMMPLLVSCVSHISIAGRQLAKMIHPEDFDRCLDAEALAFVALREYLSYALPQKDYNTLATFTDEKITATFEGAIMPMARDALIYVIEPYVPVTHNGSRWTADTTNIDNSVDIFELLNSVLCYYADVYSGNDWGVSARRGEYALGAAALLGIVDPNGNSLVNDNNDLWTNLNNAINRLLPVVGTLQGKGYKNVDSEALIRGDIINGILDIKTANADTGLMGVSNFIYRFLTIVSAEPIQTTPIVRTVYDVLKDLINGLLGPRYTTGNPKQQWTPVPNASSAHPFDDFFKRASLAGTARGDYGDGKGAIIKAINNFIEFSGYGTSGVTTYNNGTRHDTILPGLTFAVSAANSFFNFLPFIGDHQLKLATATFDPDAIPSAKSTANYSNNLVLKNNSVGINIAYVDGMDGNQVKQLGRYYIQPTGLQVTSPTGTATYSQPSSNLIAPGESINIPVTTKYVADADSGTSYTATVTYNIVFKSSTSQETIATGLETSGYQYLSGGASWKDVLYPEDRKENGIYRFPESMENNSDNRTMGTAPNQTRTSAGFADYLNLLYPTHLVLGTDNLSIINQYGYRVRNNGVLNSAKRTIDGIYCYKTGSFKTNNLTTAATQYVNENTLSSVTIDDRHAMPVFDKLTGDLLKNGVYDITYNNGGNWDNNGGNGYTQDQIDGLLDPNTNSNITDAALVKVRTHVAYTLQQALNNGMIAAYYIDTNNVYSYIFLQPGNSGYKYDVTLDKISMSTGMDGIYINSTKFERAKNGSSYVTFFNYDGVTPVQAGSVDMNICFYNSANNGRGKCTTKLVVADTSKSSALTDATAELTALLANYRQSDFLDYDGTSSAAYANAQDAIVKGLSATVAPLSATNAEALSDRTVLSPTTKETIWPTGDLAYVPFTTSNDSTLPAIVKSAAYVGGQTKDGVVCPGVAGVYYFDANGTMPIYSNVELTNPVNGKDPAGKDVILKDGHYYLANEVVKATEWAFDFGADNPYRKELSTQKVNDNGDKVYEQIEYVYRDANGNKVKSTDIDTEGNLVWRCKFPATEYKRIKSTDEDTRGLYSKALDRIDYRIDMLKEQLDPTVADVLVTDVAAIREDLDASDFDIITYNKMAEFGRDIEKLFKFVVTYDIEEELTDDNGDPILDEDGKAKRGIVRHKDVEFSYSDYKKLRDRADREELAIILPEGREMPLVKSEVSSVQADEYVRLFNFYFSKVVERGYIGKQLEAEILCASNGAYNAFTVTAPVRDRDGNVTTDGTVSSASVAAPEFGAYVDGQLVNQGPVIYPANLWSDYVNALAEAVATAQLGNGSYAHKTRAYYDLAADDYDAQVVDCYNADTNLQMAEIALENTMKVTLDIPTGATITYGDATYSSDVVIAVPTNEYVGMTAGATTGYVCTGMTFDGEPAEANDNGDGTFTLYFKVKTDCTVGATVVSASTLGTKVSGKITIAGNYTGLDTGFGLVGINIIANGEVLGTSAEDGTFSVNVPEGVTELTISGPSTIARTVTLTSNTEVTNASISIVMADYTQDGRINNSDKSVFLGTLSSGTYDVYCDYNADGRVNAADKSAFLGFVGKTVAYPALALN